MSDLSINIGEYSVEDITSLVGNRRWVLVLDDLGVPWIYSEGYFDVLSDEWMQSGSGYEFPSLDVAYEFLYENGYID